MPMMFPIQTKMFQSTYLYKVRRIGSAYIRARKDVSIHVPI